MRRIGGEKRLEPDLRLRVLARLKGLQRRVELLSRLIEHRHPGADDRRSGRGRGGRRPFAEFERGARGRRLAHERRARRRRPQRARRAGRVRIGIWVECVRPPRPWRDARLARGQGRFGDVRLWRSAFGALAEPEFNVLAELLQLRFEPTLRVLQFLDPAVGLPKFFLEPVDAHHQPGGVVGISRPHPEYRPAAQSGGGKDRTALEPAPKAQGSRPMPRPGASETMTSLASS